jgi:hypothetical protein
MSKYPQPLPNAATSTLFEIAPGAVTLARPDPVGHLEERGHNVIAIVGIGGDGGGI